MLIIPEQDVDKKTSETVVASGISSLEHVPFTDGDAAFINDAYSLTLQIPTLFPQLFLLLLPQRTLKLL